MNEVQRQAYLKVMGIQTYFPKSVLVGAKQSPAYDYPVEDPHQPDLSKAKQARAGISIKPQRRSEKDLAAQGTGGQRTERKAAEGLAEDLKGASRRKAETSAAARVGQAGEPQQSEPATVNGLGGSSVELAKEEKLKATATSEESISSEKSNELRFKLRYFKINEQLAVIDEVPHQRSERLNTEDMALLQAILAALKLDTTGLDFRPESFSWPLAEDLAMKNDPSEEAKRALSGFVQMRQETDGFTNLLVFAAQVDSLLVKQKNVSDFAATGSNYFITVTSSLHSMLAYPALKRDVWQQLQPLRRRLADSN